MNVKMWYIPLCILLIAAFTPWMKEVQHDKKLEASVRLETAPAYSIDKVRSEFKWIRSAEIEWSGLRPEEVKLPATPSSYWEFLDRSKMLEDALFRLEKTSEDYSVRNEAMFRLKSLTTGQPVSIINENFKQKFGIEKMMETRPKSLYVDRRRDIPLAESKAPEKFLQGFFWAMPIMFWVFVVRLKAKDLMVWPELWRLVPVSMLWPVGLIFYPRDIQREEQIKSAACFVAQLASIAVAFLGIGPAIPFAKAQVKSGGGTKVEKKSKSTFGYGIELYPQTAGVDAGWITSPWYAHSHALPKGLNLSGFGFVEMGGRKSQLFTNNSLNLSHAKSAGAMFTAEIGGSATAAFLQIGPRFNLVKAPGIGKIAGKVVKSVVAGPLWRVRGPTCYQEWFLSWVSREVSLPGGFKISTEGFMRFRPGPRAAAGQPQVILRHPKIRHTQFMTEVWMLGTKPTFRFGIQFAK